MDDPLARPVVLSIPGMERVEVRPDLVYREGPELRFDLPELQYSDRLNCAAQLLAGPPDDRPVFHTPDGPSWT